MSDLKAIGLLGGTFDPIHFGHLRAALEIYELNQLDEMRLIPCNHPPHRSTPLATALDRLTMAKLAIEETTLLLDDREMKREGPSYTLETITSLRQEFPRASLCFVLGTDAFLGLETWYEWEKILTLCNIIVICREGWEISASKSTTALLAQRALAPQESLQQFTAGKIVQQTITALNISASLIRHLIRNGRSPQFLLPESVYQYIRKHSLYGYSENFYSIPQGEPTK